jgi:hypothetical protein
VTPPASSKPAESPVAGLLVAAAGYALGLLLGAHTGDMGGMSGMTM